MKISIAMCTYNGEKWINQQLDSLAKQTRLPDEVVICDDCSSDETVKIIREFVETAPFKVVLYENETNLTVTRNFEKSISLCTGDIIFLCDQDDVWLPQRIANAVEVFEKDQSVGLVLTNAQIVDQQLVPRGDTIWDTLRILPSQLEKISNGQLATWEFKLYGMCWGITMAFRAKYVPFLLPIPAEWTHDFWIGFVLFLISKPYFISEIGVKYRIHGKNAAGARRRASRRKDLKAKLLRMKSRKQSKPADRQYRRLLSAYNHLSALKGNENFLALEMRQDFGASLDMLYSIVAHWNARAQIMRSQLTRPIRVARELSTRRYHTYSSGWQSAIVDLFGF